MLDYLIINGSVCTGRLEKAQVRHIGIQGEKIVGVEKPDRIRADNVIDATGMILAPGFIDPHASTGFGYFFPKAADHKLYQGITTEVFGNCGTSPAPIGEHLMDTMQRLSDEIGFQFDWESLSEYFSRIQDQLQLYYQIVYLLLHQ